MCPNMHFAIALKIDSPYDESKIKQTVECLKKAHPLLSSVISTNDNGQPFYEQKNNSEVPVYYMNA